LQTWTTGSGGDLRKLEKKKICEYPMILCHRASISGHR